MAPAGFGAGSAPPIPSPFNLSGLIFYQTRDPDGFGSPTGTHHGSDAGACGEKLDDGRELIMDAELLAHADVRDAPGESRDNVCVGDAGDLILDLAEALDELEQRLSWDLVYRLQVVLAEGALVSASEVGDERVAEIPP